MTAEWDACAAFVISYVLGTLSETEGLPEESQQSLSG
jgi:hypothetical protein